MVEYRGRTKKKYTKNLYGILFILAGAFLLIEHIWAWGEFSFFDFFGHEWLGLVLILIGIILNINFKTPISSELVKLWDKIKRK